VTPSTRTYTSHRACSSLGDISLVMVWPTRTVIEVLLLPVERARARPHPRCVSKRRSFPFSRSDEGRRHRGKRIRIAGDATCVSQLRQSITRLPVTMCQPPAILGGRSCLRDCTLPDDAARAATEGIGWGVLACQARDETCGLLSLRVPMRFVTLELRAPVCRLPMHIWPTSRADESAGVFAPCIRSCPSITSFS